MFWQFDDLDLSDIEEELEQRQIEAESGKIGAPWTGCSEKVLSDARCRDVATVGTASASTCSGSSSSTSPASGSQGLHLAASSSSSSSSSSRARPPAETDLDTPKASASAGIGSSKAAASEGGSSASSAASGHRSGQPTRAAAAMGSRRGAAAGGGLRPERVEEALGSAAARGSAGGGAEDEEDCMQVMTGIVGNTDALLEELRRETHKHGRDLESAKASRATYKSHSSAMLRKSEARIAERAATIAAQEAALAANERAIQELGDELEAMDLAVEEATARLACGGGKDLDALLSEGGGGFTGSQIEEFADTLHGIQEVARSGPPGEPGVYQDARRAIATSSIDELVQYILSRVPAQSDASMTDAGARGSTPGS